MARAVLIRRLVWTLACASLAFGVWRSVQPDALVDVHRVIEWTRVLLGGACPYTLAQETDDPPWALVTLSPLLLSVVVARARHRSARDSAVCCRLPLRPSEHGPPSALVGGVLLGPGAHEATGGVPGVRADGLAGLARRCRRTRPTARWLALWPSGVEFDAT